MIARKLVLRSLIHGGNYNRPISIADFVRWPMEGGNAFEAFYWRRTATTFTRMSTASSSEVETTALTEEEKERKERSITEGKKSDKNAVVSSYWGVSKPRITREDGTEWPWNCFMPWETYRADLSIDLKKHHVPKTFLDKFAYRTVKLLRIPTDIFFQGVFFNAFFVLYILSPKLAHRVVGYLEEEAVHSYTEYLKDIEDGKIENIPAPAIAIDYWRLPKDATLKDVITVIRADEAHHRDVNHFASDIHFQGKDLKESAAPVGRH